MRPSLLRRPRRALLRTRVLAGVLLVTLLALAAFDVAAVTGLRSYLIGQTDSQLRQVIGLYFVSVTGLGVFPRSAGSSPRDRRPANAGANAASPPEAQVLQHNPPSPAVIQAPFLRPYSVITVSGKIVKAVSPAISLGEGVVIGNAGPAPGRLPASLATLAGSGQAWTSTSPSGEPARLMAAPDPGTGIIVAMTSLDGVDKTVGRLELLLVIGSAAAGLAAAGGVAWIMRRGLRPIETMAGQADAITAGDLTSRVGPHDPRTEVGRLGEALNGMLSRIEDFITEREASQEATRRFFADASCAPRWRRCAPTPSSTSRAPWPSARRSTRRCGGSRWRRRG